MRPQTDISPTHGAQCSHDRVTTATPEAIWAAWADVTHWSDWNAGVAAIDLHGPFERDTTFTMTMPDGETLESRLVAVDEPFGFTDETILGDTRVLVEHRCAREERGTTRITYVTSVTGPDAAAICDAVSADFSEVMAALANRAEHQSQIGVGCGADRRD